MVAGDGQNMMILANPIWHNIPPGKRVDDVDGVTEIDQGRLHC
jgi:hypothetical protein